MTAVGGLFFPQRIKLGLDSRDATPELTRAVVQLAAEVRSFERVASLSEKIWQHKVSCSTVRRLARQVGQELAEAQSAPPPQEQQHEPEVVVPEVAVVSCDGGRIRVRQPGQGRGVHLAGENGWRETKNAIFERMRRSKPADGEQDPCPELPTSFRTAKKVASIAEKAAPLATGDEAAESIDSDGARPQRVIYEGPQRVLRTTLSSMACSEDFGPRMRQEAQRRRFHEAPLRAFIGDGLNWNWAIWEKHFPTFIPILDFIHAIQYVYRAAVAWATSDDQAWALYVRLITLCWQGQVEEVVEQLRAACHERGIELEQLEPGDPHEPLAAAIRYLTNNGARMDYPRYRRLGLPIASAPMESFIKQMNLRVKGTEMFWDDPAGAEAILQLRAAALSDDGRLDQYLANRPGYPYHRRTTTPKIAA